LEYTGVEKEIKIMLKKSESFGIGTSFHGITIRATGNQLSKIVGEYSKLKSGDGKVTFQWILENEDEEIITIYDWKMYREVGIDEEIEWNIGGHNKQSTEKAKEEILNLLNK
jgi:hypothetical protein